MAPIVLLGGGYHHYKLLQSLDDEKLRDCNVILVSQSQKVLPLQHLPLFSCQGVSASQVSLDLWSACQRKSVFYLEDTCLRVDRDSRKLQLKNFGKLDFSSLSIETDVNLGVPVQKRNSNPFDVHQTIQFKTRLSHFFQEVHRHCPREVRVIIRGWRREALELAYLLKMELSSSCELCDIVIVTGRELESLGRFNKEKQLFKNVKSLGIRVLDNIQIEKNQSQLIGFSDGSELACDVFVDFESQSFNNVMEKIMGTGLPGNWAVGRDLSYVKDSEIFVSGQQVQFEREDRWVHEISDEEINKVLLHNIFVRQFEEPTINCRDYLNRPPIGLFEGSGFSKAVLEEKSFKKWQDNFKSSINQSKEILVTESSHEDCKASLKYQADHMSRPWKGLVGASSESDKKNFRLTSFNGFNSWGSYGQSAIKICEIAILKTLSRGIDPNQLRFHLTLPNKKTHLTQHIFESSFRAIELVCEKHGINIDGGDTFDGAHWHLSITIGGPVYSKMEPNLQPHDYLLITRPLGFGLLWAGRMKNPFDSSWIGKALNSQILPEFRQYKDFVKRWEPSSQILIEEWGFLFHCLEKLPSHQQLMVNFREMPRWEGIDTLIPKKVSHPGLNTNWDRIEKDVAFSREDVSATNSILWDSLSQGALVFGVKADNWLGALQDLQAMGYEEATLVGCTRPKSKGTRVILTDWRPY